MLIISGGSLSAGELTDKPVQQDSTVSDDTPWPEKRSSRSAWENIVSFPGLVVYTPFKLFFQGTKRGVNAAANRKWFDRLAALLQFRDVTWGALPTYSSRAGIGLKLYRNDVITEGAQFQLGFSNGIATPKRQRYFLRLKNVRMGELLRFGARARYQNYADERFYGIGPSSRERDETSFAHENSSFEASLDAHVSKRLIAGINFGYEINNVLPGASDERPTIGDIYTLAELPGLENQLNFWRGIISLAYDGRNAPGNPFGGTMLELNAATYIQNSDDPQYGFTRMSADISQFINIFRQRVLVLRLSAMITETESGKQVPFYYLSELGRTATIRGLSRGRFLDKDRLFGSLEWRYPLMIRQGNGIDASLFFDFGQVADDISNVAIRDMEPVFGVGFRIYSKRLLIANIQIARSSELTRVHLSIND